MESVHNVQESFVTYEELAVQCSLIPILNKMEALGASCTSCMTVATTLSLARGTLFSRLTRAFKWVFDRKDVR